MAYKGTSDVFVATYTLTSQQIKSLSANPIQLIPAPGANKTIVIISSSRRFTYGGSNVFVAGSSQGIQLYYSTTINDGVILTNAALTAAASVMTSGTPTALNNTPVSYQNLPINIWNAAGVEISGNAANDNTFMVTVTYYIIGP